MTAARRVLYMAHPVAPTADEIERKWADVASSSRWIEAMDADAIIRCNVDNALCCLAWLHSSFPETTFIAPWITALQAGADDSDPAARDRGLVDCCAVVERCDGIVLKGPRISSGMQRETNHGMQHRIGFDVYNLTGTQDIAVITGMTFTQFMEMQ